MIIKVILGEIIAQSYNLGPTVWSKKSAAKHATHRRMLVHKMCKNNKESGEYFGRYGAEMI